MLCNFDINLIKSFYSKSHLQAMYEKQTVVCEIKENLAGMFIGSEETFNEQLQTN